MPVIGSESRLARWGQLSGRARLTLRLRLTLLYGACFIVAGAALLAITYGLFAGSVSAEKTSVGGVQVQLLSLSDARMLARSGAGLSGAVAAAKLIPKKGLPQWAFATTTAGPVPGFQARSTQPGAVIRPVRCVQGTRVVACPTEVGPPKALTRLLAQVRQNGQRQLDSVVQKANVAIKAQQHSSLASLETKSGIALAIMALISIGLGWLLAGRALRPLRTMSQRARQITEESLHERLGLDGRRDELGQLAGTFDELLARLQQAFEAQRRFVANASHELRTPLTLERALVEVALADPNPSIDSLRGTCERVLASSRQQEQLIDALLTLARGQAGLERHEEVDLGELACELLSAAAPRLSGPRLSVHSELAPAVVSGDRALLERLIGNLIDNAIVHNREGGEITIETGTAEGVAHLRVANSGARIPPERVAELTEPFRRLDQERTGPGLGLGLSIVRAIANAHGASLLLEPGAAGGLDARLDFAAVASAGSVLTAV